MKVVRAKKTDKARVVKTWRIKEETAKEIARFAKKNKIAESEIIENAIGFFVKQ